jgi:anti-sigma B factor antagonist
MEMKRSQEEGLTVLAIRGNVKVGESAQQFSAELSRLLAETTGPVLLDVSAIDYIDSTGIGELVGHMQKFSGAKRPMGLLQPHRRLTALLEVTGLVEYFLIFTDRREAFAALKSK